MNQMDAKKKYKKKPIKQKDRISETEEIQNAKVNKTILADFSSESTAGGDYVDHTAEEINPIQRDIHQQSAPTGFINDGFGDAPVDVDWSQMAIDKRKKRLYGGRTREGIKEQYNFTSGFLGRKYICLNCHRLYTLEEERCYHCNSVTTAKFNKKKIKKKRTTRSRRIYNDYYTDKYPEFHNPYAEFSRAFKYIRDLTEKPLLQLEEVPGTRLKSSGQKLPGIYAYKNEINALREPFAQWLNKGGDQAIFHHVAYKPENYTIFDKTYTVVTHYLEQLKLIRLQLWYQLYSSLGGLGSFEDIKKVSMDKKKYIKVSVPDAEGYYSYTAKHPISDKTILILSPEPEPLLDAVEDIQPIKIGTSDQVKKQLNLSKKNILYEPFKNAIHALIFKRDELIIVIPQEKSFIFPMEEDDLKKWDKYKSINAGETLSERNPSGPTRMYIEYDMDDFYSEF